MQGNGGHATQIKAEFGDVFVIAIGDNRRRKFVAEVEFPDEAWDCPFDMSVYPGIARPPLFNVKIPPHSGTVVLHGAVIGANVTLGKHCILNHCCSVDHDCEIADYVHVAPGARILGGAKVGEGALIGANAVVLPNAVVPPWAVVRACSVYPADYNVINGKPTTRKERPVAALEYAGREKLLLDFQRDI